MFDICPKATIDLKAIKENYLTMKKLVGDNVMASSVVKNDSYGLGAQRVSQSLYEAGCRNFWTAYLKEAIDIRRVLPFDANIYFLQGFSRHDIELMNTYRITPVINSINDFNEIKGNGVGFVIHVDTGLSRLGFRPDDVDKILPFLKDEKIEYIISHLACSDEKDHHLNIKQKEAFDAVLKKIRAVKYVKAGISATAGAILGKDFCYDMVRIGAFLYGIQTDNIFKPKNVFSLKTSVLQKYELESGISVGYGATYITSKKTKIAVVSIGYADGIKRSLSNKGSILFYDNAGKFYKAPICGKISMDLIACDVSDIPDHATEIMSDSIILDENYSINEMAIDAMTIPYEVLTSINFKSKRFEIHYKD